MWRAAIATMIVAGGCAADPVEYAVTTTLQSSTSTARLVFDNRLYVTHTETYEVNDYDELRDVAQTVTVRDNNIELGVVLPFAASACGSEQWMHSGELSRIEVHYVIYKSGASFSAYTNSLTCLDDEGEARTVIN